MDYRRGRSTTDAVFTLKQIIEKRREFNKETHIAFIDFEKAFDNVNRRILWNIMEKERIPKTLNRSNWQSVPQYIYHP
jgi:sorting nexin-29